MAERVDVGPQLLRAHNLLGDPVDLVLAHATAVGVMGGGDERLAEEPAREGRDGLVEHVAEIEEAAVTHERQRLAALGRVDVAQHPDLRAHSEDHGVAKLGNRVRPPSTKMVWPVMYAARSLARKHVTPAISSESPARRIGMCSSTCARLTGSSIQARLIGVTVAPGPMPLTRMPCAAYSSASVRVRFCMPPLLAE